jgi:hypothetical protein
LSHNGLAAAAVGSADQYAFFTCTGIANTLGIIYRWANTTNYWKLSRSGGFFRLDKTVAGTPTTVATSATALSSGAKIKIKVVDNTHNVYNDTGSGRVLDRVLNNITDAALNTNTKMAIVGNSASIAIDDFEAPFCISQITRVTKAIAVCGASMFGCPHGALLRESSAQQ